jgi:hypothetical protein
VLLQTPFILYEHKREEEYFIFFNFFLVQIFFAFYLSINLFIFYFLHCKEKVRKNKLGYSANYDEVLLRHENKLREICYS